MSSEWQCMYEDAEAEVKRLRALWSGSESRLAECESSLVQSQADNARLRAELERMQRVMEVLQYTLTLARDGEWDKANEAIDRAMGVE